MMNTSPSIFKVAVPCKLPGNVAGFDDTSFSIDLGHFGEQDSSYRTQNLGNQFQRETVTHREKGVFVQCISREVIHGLVDPNSNKPASLLVYDFCFDAKGPTRRILSADITFIFSSIDEEVEAPQVHKIAPVGKHLCMFTNQTESITASGEVNASAGYLGANLGIGGKRERTVSKTTSDAASVTGFMKCDTFGTNIGARWYIEENYTERKGIPHSLRVALLLHREDQANFQCVTTISVKADWKTELRRFIGSSEDKDDPILFDTAIPPTSTLHDIQNLGAINLEKIFDITSSFSNPKPELNIPSLGDGVDAVLIDEIQLDFTGSEEESLRVVSSIEETTKTVNIDFVVIHGLFGKELNRDRWFDCGPDSWLTQYANSLKSNSRIIEFKYNASVIVDGDSEETISGIRQIALSLLSKLKNLRKGEVTRTIMFLGRGIGGIIVKDVRPSKNSTHAMTHKLSQALVAASTGMGDWDDILDYSRVLLFSDCPHKSRDRNRLENSLGYTLFATRPDFSQSASPLFFTGSLISKLASEVMEVNASFILSKLHLRSHLISIYEERKKADYVDDHNNGWSTKIIETRSEEDTHKSSVLDHLDDLKECIIPLHESRLRHERLLLSLATPLRPLITPLNETWWLKDYTKYKQWLDSPGTQLLYLHGNVDDVIQEAASQAFYHLERVQRTRDKQFPVLFFEFDSWDARRCSLSHMLSTFIAQLTCHYPDWKNNIEYMSSCVEKERGWTYRDLVSWFTLFNRIKQSIVISRFDECDIESRRAFLDLISYTARMSEHPWKIVVTSGTSKVLLEELRSWPEVDIVAQSPEDYAGSMRPRNSLTHRENMMLQKYLLRFPRLGDHDRSIILKHLAAINIPLLKTQLWGALSSIKVEDSEEILESVLDSYFRGIPDQNVAKCALMWLLHSKRPLSKRELAEIMFLESENDRGNDRSPDPSEVDNFVVKLELWFAGFIEVENDEMFVRNGRLREILGKHERKCSDNYWWIEASEAAHFKIAKTCLKYLSLPDTQINLKIPNGAMSERNPRLCLGNLLSYAVQYWFQHFQSAKDSQNYPLEILIGLIQNIDLESWSRMFWELSSPITRSPSPWESPFPIFAGQGEIDLIKSKNDEDFGAGLVEASLNGRQSTAHRMLDIHECPTPILLNAIQLSTAGGHEQLAIDLLGRLPTETKLSIQQWGTNILWRSARANLHRLADTVLSMGCGPDPEAKYGSEWNMTPLSQCSIDGHLEMTKVLVKHKANVEFPGLRNRTPLAMAALEGHANVVRFLATQANAKIDVIDIDGRRPIDSSCVWGNQEVVMELLRLEPYLKYSSEDQNSPLVAAAQNGNDECVKIIIGDEKADKAREFSPHCNSQGRQRRNRQTAARSSPAPKG
ncbi:uncharacterized protein EAF02_006688 [Botrytis sinoallii]|uniref:uncharacterized protein n=1 Tax=Botrytis sinoallii TaxID=1463999 RepID=UPI0019017834|nr:uncharacterized protein EAF02_006688 [Botrytis sinoallii]KAF7880797.1 hypothetical protein EAF02_006688 [Botrytis sinoallii]